MGVREDIKVILAQSSWTLVEVAKKMSSKTGKEYSCSNLSQKMSRKTLKYEEAKMIGDILGYDLVFVKRKL